MKPIARPMALMVVAWLMSGCQQPSEITLKPAEDDTNIEVSAVAQTESTFVSATVDSSGLLPAEQMRFGGWLTVTHVKYDLGDGRPTSISYSRVFVADSTLHVSGQFIGFSGKQLVGGVTVNGKQMLRIPHRIPGVSGTRGDSVDTGVEYVAYLGNEWSPIYRWQTRPAVGFTVDELIATPDTIVLLSPRAGTTIARDRELSLQWKAGGGGTMNVVVSRYAELRRAFVPLLNFRVKVNAGIARVPPRILKQFPAGTYMLTFIQANRHPDITVDRYAGTLTIQAASIYNCLVGLQ